ncbi:MAG: hypothetical protein COA58_10390 [Bacteroidetes bacterium]|nr:MAG: hypothetical protein COA58_10390 [Bacteroidota bacterium]
MMKKLFTAFICILGFSQCSNKVYSLDNLPNQFIEIGSYGGFAGTSKTYYFFPNGQRFLHSGVMGGDKETREIEKLKPKAFKSLLKGLNKMDFGGMSLSETGNMNYFIRIKDKKEENKVQWTNMDTAPEALVSFYRETLKNINKATN